MAVGRRDQAVAAPKPEAVETAVVEVKAVMVVVATALEEPTWAVTENQEASQQGIVSNVLTAANECVGLTLSIAAVFMSFRRNLVEV